MCCIMSAPCGNIYKISENYFIYCEFLTFDRSSSTMLSYEVSVIPRFSFPAIFLERIIGCDLPVNLQALAHRAEKSYEDTFKTSFLGSSLARSSLAILPSPAININETLEDNLSFGEFMESFASSNVGSLPPSTEPKKKWGLFGRICRLDRPCMVDEVHLRRFDGLLVTPSPKLHCNPSLVSQKENNFSSSDMIIFGEGKWRRSSLCGC